MFYRSGLWLAALSMLLLAQPFAASVSAARQFQEGASPQSPAAVLPEKSADHVLGQAAFDTNDGSTSATSLWLPAGVAIAPPNAPNAGRIFVAEHGTPTEGNHRVLSWPDAESLASGQAADLVIGQDNFTTRGGGTDSNRLYGPEAAVVDTAGNLWVADTENNRILRFDYPLYNGMNASIVLGQPNFTSSQENQGLPGPKAFTLDYPRGLAMDAAGNLYVADDANNRVLRYSPPFTIGMNASGIFGQVFYDEGFANRGANNPGQDTLWSPKGIAMDAAGHLYVAEYNNNRVVRYDPPFSDGMLASAVYGQPGYTTGDPNYGGLGPSSLLNPVDIAVSSAGNALYVTDQGNVRVLGYLNPVGDAVADEVYGQPDFTSTTPNNGGISADSINDEPLGLAVDAFGDLFHADYRNNRLLVYDSPTQVVGNGNPGSCNESVLDAALADAGRIQLDCGTAQINLSGAKGISVGTILDGGGSTTLKGSGADRLFVVNGGAYLILRNITLTDGYSTEDGGAIYNGYQVQSAALKLENTTIKNSQSGLSGGAILSYGALTIIDSLLEGNQALNGGALYPRWTGARTTIVNSIFRNNHATDTTNGWGGALLAWDGAPVIIQDSDIYNNTAQQGGGIYNFANSYIHLEDDILRDNTAAVSGGAIFNAGVVDMSGVTLSGNTAGYSGGALLNNSQAFYGLYLTNSTLSGNSAGSFGGGLDNLGDVLMENVTMSGNSAGTGGGIYNFDALASVTLENTIVANSPSGGNCGGASLTTDNSDEYSLSSDQTCSLAGKGSQNGLDPKLTGLGNYGGPTQVHMLKPGSPAIDGVLDNYAPPIDQRGVSRPQGNAADIGAVELTKSDYIKKVFLPMTIVFRPNLP